jgi:hypothetical protein
MAIYKVNWNVKEIEDNTDWLSIRLFESTNNQIIFIRTHQTRCSDFYKAFMIVNNSIVEITQEISMMLNIPYFSQWGKHTTACNAVWL